MSRRVLMIGATLLLAVLGTVAVLSYVGKADARALAGRRAVTVLVAAKKVAAGTSARDADREGLLRAEQMPAETVPADALGQVSSDVADLVAGSDIQPGQLVLRPLFVARSQQQQTGGLVIPDGKVAVSVAVSGAQRVADYAQVGSKVAVFDTFNLANGGSGRTPAGDGLEKQHDYVQATRLVLSGVQVIAVGPASSGSSATNKGSALASNGSTSSTSGGSDQVLVTLAVTQAQAEKLILVAQAGAVYLALESDTSKTGPSGGVDNRGLFAS